MDRKIFLSSDYKSNKNKKGGRFLKIARLTGKKLIPSFSLPEIIKSEKKLAVAL